MTEKFITTQSIYGDLCSIFYNFYNLLTQDGQYLTLYFIRFSFLFSGLHVFPPYTTVSYDPLT